MEGGERKRKKTSNKEERKERQAVAADRSRRWPRETFSLGGPVGGGMSV